MTQRRSRALQTLAKKVANQISNIIRSTKGKRTLLLTFHQLYSAKNTRSDTHKSRKPFFPNRKQQKTHLSQPKKFQKKEDRKKFESFRKFFDEGLR